MKSRKVLLGLFVGLFVCCTAGVSAQTKANYQNTLTEIGPDNIGGRVRSIVWDRNASSDQVVYVGAANGGLYTRDFINEEHTSWDYVPCYQDGREVTLPISAMVQHPTERTIFIATGESQYQKGINIDAFATLGRGIFRFNPNDNSFTVIPSTVPQNLESNFASVNRVACMYVNNTLHFFAATPKGLYRWVVANENDWNNAPEVVYEGSVEDLEVIASRNMALFTSGNQLYRIGNVSAKSDPVNISNTNEAFGGNNTRIELAVAPSNGNYVYAMVMNKNYTLQALYLCKDQQHWTRLTTSTITPFNALASGDVCGAIAVDPLNADRVFIAGATLWVGQGYVDGSYYQWNKLSYAEQELNGGNYMSMVYANAMFVHSGINDIQMVGDYALLLATNGGVFTTFSDSPQYFTNVSRGINNVQFNSIDVCPDGSVFGGAVANGVPFIEARLAHDGGDVNDTWYDNTTTMNHNANVLWHGNGGQVAASMFQQVKPLSRRGIYVSSENGAYGRAFGDYADYTQTQTWTIGADLIDISSAGAAIPQMALWETDTNTVINDSLYIKIDSNNVVFCNGVTRRLNVGDTIFVGDSMFVSSTAHFAYPFAYRFTKQIIVTEEPIHMKVSNPLISRAFIVGKNGVMNKVYMNWYPMDFRRVCNEDDLVKKMNWPALYSVTGGKKMIHAIAPSRDGNTLFISVVDTGAYTTQVIRVRGLNTVNYCTDTLNILKQLSEDNRDNRVYTYDTISFNGSQTLNRAISSIAVDPRSGRDNVILTFDGYNTDFPSVLYLSNATADNYQVTDKTPSTVNGPVYSAMFEFTEGSVYIGSEEGVWKATEASFASANTSWTEYGAFDGVPVTAMRQQIRNLPVARNVVYAGVNRDDYLFAKTKYPYAMYFGTYGRGIFMDMQFVTDTVNEIVDSTDLVSIPTVQTIGQNSVSVYPNPAYNEANLDITINNAGNAIVKVYDLSGRMVMNTKIGRLEEGSHNYKLDCQNFKSGMYLVNVIVGNQSAATKLVVR